MSRNKSYRVFGQTHTPACLEKKKKYIHTKKPKSLDDNKLPAVQTLTAAADHKIQSLAVFSRITHLQATILIILHYGYYCFTLF